MWKEFNVDGTLANPNFLETVLRLKPLYILRSIGGTLYIIGAVVALINLYRTAKQGNFWANEEVSVAARVIEPTTPTKAHSHWHRVLEGKPVRFALLALVAVIIGGVVEFVPTALIQSNIPTIASVHPYTPLELEGRDLYIREGCVGCHSQMIRPFRSETERYGQYSHAGEFVYDRPFLWGSKRTGPDLHRIGGKYLDAWHYNHMRDPTTTSPRSLMPAYTWLYDSQLDISHTEGKIITLRKLGVPYAAGFETQAVDALKKQAAGIAEGLRASGFKDATADKEIIAVIAYLQRLGTDIKGAKP